MLRGIVAFKRYFVLGIALAAPIVGAGCGNCNTVKTSPCTPYRAVPATCTPVAAVVNAPAQVVYQVPAGTVCAAPGASVSTPVSGYVPAGSASVVYKPISSRSYADALENIDGADTKVIRTSSAGSSLVSSVVTPGDLAAAGITLPAAPAAGRTIVAATSYPVEDVVVTESFEGRTAIQAPARGVARRHAQPRRHAPRRRGMPVDTVTVAAAPTSAMPTGTPVYITPGGTPVSAYVPAPASGSYLEGAAATGYLPVTERRGPNNAVVHYSTRSICKYDPARGEDCVWTSGF